MVFRTGQDFGSWIRTTWLPYLHRIPEDLHTAFIEALIDQYLSMYPADTNGAIHIGMMRLEIEAEKTG